MSETFTCLKNKLSPGRHIQAVMPSDSKNICSQLSTPLSSTHKSLPSSIETVSTLQGPPILSFSDQNHVALILAGAPQNFKHVQTSPLLFSWITTPETKLE